MRTVLVVDDDGDVREITAASLRHVGGWEVTQASSGREALSAARQSQPDAIVLDVAMPDLDGLVVVERLRADEVTRHIPIVLLTASGRVGNSQRWDDSPVAGVLAKPFDAIALPAQIADLIGWTV